MPTMPLRRNLWLTSPMLRGDDVLVVQQRLVAAGATLTQDGLYGQGTRAAVEAYQRQHGLLADGIVGIATWSHLIQGLAGSANVMVPPQRQATDIVDLAALRSPHSLFADGVPWSLGSDGISLQGGSPSLVPSARERAVAQRVFDEFAQPLATVLCKQHVPVELVVACICTESRGDPQAKRLEPGADRAQPERTPTRVSYGLMQTLLSTAREALRQPSLPLLDLLVPEVSIRAGATYIWNQGQRTGFDPPLVAAAYNAGSLRRNDGRTNHWKLVQWPIGTAEHVDRFCRYFNAALAIDKPLDGVTSFRALLGLGTRAGTGPAPTAPTLAPAPAPPGTPAHPPQAATTAAAPARGGVDLPRGIVLQRGDDDSARRWGGTVRTDVTGGPVAALQRALAAVGAYAGEADGAFGPATEAAVRRFQWLVANGTVRLRVPRGAAPAKGILEPFTGTPGLDLDGQADAATMAALRDWTEGGWRATSPLVRVKTSRFRRITRAGGFETLDYPEASADEILANAAFVPGLAELDDAATEAGVALRLNQTFRVESMPVSGAVVPPATRSQHLIGHAADLNVVADDVVVNSAMVKAGNVPRRMRDFIAAAKRRGLRWGGDFTPADPPHFDLQVPANSAAYDIAFFFCQRSFAERHPIRPA